MKINSNLRNVSFQLLCAFILCICSYAQSPMVNLYFVCLPADENTEPLELLLDEKNTIKVELPTNNISQSYQVPALKEWKLGKATVDRGVFHFETKGTAKSIDATDQLIVVSRKSEEDGGGLVLIPIDYSQTVFSGGKYYLVNLTKTQIGGTVGKSEFSVAPDTFSLIAPEPDEVKEAFKYCYATLSYKKDEEMKPFISSTWRFNEKVRSLIFLYNLPVVNSIKMHSIRLYIQ